MAKIEKRGPINIQDIDNALDYPGIYVWYAKLELGKADWHEDFSGGNESGKSSLTKALRLHSEKFSQQQIAITALANFSEIWKGALEEDASARWHSDKDQPNPFEFNSDLSKALEKNHTRAALISVIEEAFPFFFSPLYVGLAIEQTLKQRLRQHKKSFLDLWDATQRSPQKNRELANSKSFAERAVSLGFGPDDLFCYTLGIDASTDGQLSKEELHHVIASSEWFINRWTTPILGKR